MTEFIGSIPELDMSIVRAVRRLTLADLIESFALCRWAVYDVPSRSPVVVRDDREDLLAYRYVMQERGLVA